MHDYPVGFQDGKTHDGRALEIGDFWTARELGRQEFQNKLDERLGVKFRAVTSIDQLVLNSKRTSFAEHDKIVLKLLRPHLIQSYHNAETITHIQQKAVLIERALESLALGIIVLTPDGKVRLATARAVQQVRNYLGLRSMHGNRLPESLWLWVKRQEVASRGKRDVLLRPSPLVLQRQTKRLVIRLVSGRDQVLLLREKVQQKWNPSRLRHHVLVCARVTHEKLVKVSGRRRTSFWGGVEVTGSSLRS